MTGCRRMLDTASTNTFWNSRSRVCLKLAFLSLHFHAWQYHSLFCSCAYCLVITKYNIIDSVLYFYGNVTISFFLQCTHPSSNQGAFRDRPCQQVSFSVYTMSITLYNKDEHDPVHLCHLLMTAFTSSEDGMDTRSVYSLKCEIISGCEPHPRGT